MFEKRVILGIVLLIGFFAVVNATDVSVSDVSGTVLRASISDAVNLYGYEVKFSIDSGEVSNVSSSEFLGTDGMDATYGYRVSGGYLYAYGSKLEESGIGVDGVGALFDVTYSGELTLRSLLAINGHGEEEEVTYNEETPSEPESGSSVGGSSSGSGSGAGGTTEIVSSFIDSSYIVVVPDSIEINAIIGAKETGSFTILNNGERSIALEIETLGLGNTMRLDKNLINLEPWGKKSIKFEILASDTELISGKIQFKKFGVVVKEVPVTMNVRTENFLFDARVTVPVEYRNVRVGKNLLVDIELLQVGPAEKIDVVANYIVKDFLGNVFVEESETFYVLGSKKLTREINTAGLKSGDYVIGVEIVYPGAFAVSSTQFRVVDGEILPIDSVLLIKIIGGVIFGLVVLFLVWAFTRNSKVKKKR